MKTLKKGQRVAGIDGFDQPFLATVMVVDGPIATLLRDDHEASRVGCGEYLEEAGKPGWRVRAREDLGGHFGGNRGGSRLYPKLSFGYLKIALQVFKQA